MATFDDVIGTQVVGSSWLQGAGFILVIFMLVVMMIILTVFVFFVLRFFKYNIQVELWERRGEEVFFYGDDKAARVHKKGVTYLRCLKNSDDRFKRIIFPESKYLYKRKIFGKKCKYLIDGDEVRPFKMHIDQSDYGIGLDVMPTHERIDFIQKMEQAMENYGEKGNKLAIAGMVLGAGIVMLGFFMFFVIWQSNAANADAMIALANAISADAAARGSTIPLAPS